MTHTALLIYQMLTQYYGMCSFASFADCTELMNGLHNTPCMTGRVQEYVSKWRMGISRLQSAKFPFSIKICISQFVQGLPLIATFTSLRADISHHINSTGDQDFGAFISLTETVLKLDTIFRTSSNIHNPCMDRTLSTPISTPVSTAPPVSCYDLIDLQGKTRSVVRCLSLLLVLVAPLFKAEDVGVKSSRF